MPLEFHWEYEHATSPRHSQQIYNANTYISHTLPAYPCEHARNQ